MNPSSQPENQLDNDKDLEALVESLCHRDPSLNEPAVKKEIRDYTQSKLKAFAGEVEEALGERKKFNFGNKTSIGMMCEEAYVNGQNNIIDSVSKSLKAIKEKYINPQKEGE